MIPDIVGMPWDFAKGLLYDADIRYNAVITSPSKSHFALAADDLYVVRQCVLDDGIWEITLAARLLKEVSRNGL